MIFNRLKDDMFGKKECLATGRISACYQLLLVRIGILLLKLKLWWISRKLKNTPLTPIETALKGYCQRVIDGTLQNKDHNSEYEAYIEEVRKSCSISRQDAAMALYKSLTMGKDE